MTTEEKAKFKIGDKIRHKVHTEITADIIDIREGEYILRNSNGTHLPVEWQDCYELVESEDERIRRDIIAHFSKILNDGGLVPSCWFTWLEKH